MKYRAHLIATSSLLHTQMLQLDSTQARSFERPVGLRMRPDLVAQASEFQGESCWVIKDPLAMKYFRLREPEYCVC